ncbi:DUF1700 domain-containing protein [Mycoplasmatota bacterium zrk1]
MNRLEFIKKLKEYLYYYELRRDVVEDIISDHEAIIEEAIENGMSETDIINRLGSPKAIAKCLKDERKVDYGSTRLTALSPFIAGIIYALLGFGFDLWHPTWLVFMIVPITAIVGTRRTMTTMTFLTSLSPMVVVSIYLVYGFTYDIWHPTWLMFMIIPILGLFVDRENPKNILLAVIIIITSIAYLYMDTYEILNHNWIVFFVPFILGVYSGHVQISVFNNSELLETRERIMSWISIGSAVIYSVIGIVFDIWHPTWLLFLIIPIAGVIMYGDNNE